MIFNTTINIAKKQMCQCVLTYWKFAVVRIDNCRVHTIFEITGFYINSGTFAEAHTLSTLQRDDNSRRMNQCVVQVNYKDNWVKVWAEVVTTRSCDCSWKMETKRVEEKIISCKDTIEIDHNPTRKYIVAIYKTCATLNLVFFLVHARRLSFQT